MKHYLLAISLLAYFLTPAQNEQRFWYFGIKAGLDFSTTPPTVLNNGALFTSEGCSTISDGAGNLLFYTDGDTVYTSTHTVMANGTGLMGHYSTSQSALIVKQPGSSSVYYVFTQDAQAGANGFRYSVVDMSLAAGMGSVTVKNVLLHSPSTEKLAAAYHCNGRDIWVVTHDWNSDQFRSVLVTAAGVATVPVLSATGSTITGSNVNTLGAMRISHNGRKLAFSNYSKLELYDFDPATGSVSNGFTLSAMPGAFGCEFSPDGSKLYGGGLSTYRLFQWDMCAGSASAIIASQYTIGTQQAALAALQLAPNGKIYGGRFLKPDIAVINNPNAAGAGCNFVELGQSVATNSCMIGLPNFVGGEKKPTPAAFTSSPACLTYTFNAPALATVNACAPSNFTISGIAWSFGDPASGSANTSTLSSPAHTFSGPGTYTVSLINYYYCTSDTVKQVVTITEAPLPAVSGPTNICKGDKRTYTVTGTGTYKWSNNVTTPTVVLSPTTTTGYSVTLTNSAGCSATRAFTLSVSPCLETPEPFSSNSLKIYPTVVSGYLTVDVESPLTIYIHNHTGALLGEFLIEPGNGQINLKDFAAGIYFIRTADTSYRSCRIVKTE